MIEWSHAIMVMVAAAVFGLFVTVKDSAYASDTVAWTGLQNVSGHKGYTDTPMGQIHYRVLGEGAPVLLLHQTPWFSVQYAKVQPLFAERGLQTIAVDTPGFGFSDSPDKQPTIEDYANNLSYILDDLEIEKLAVAGFHTGASIAAAFAHLHPGRATCLILDGAPLYTEEERRQRLSVSTWDQSPRADGSHLSDRFLFIRDRITNNTAELESINWSVLSFFMSGEAEHYGHVAAFTYDMKPAIQEITIPTLIMSHVTDSLHKAAGRIMEMRPDFQYKEFKGGNSHVVYDNPGIWVEAVSPFVKLHNVP